MPVSGEERMRVLRLVEEGRLSVEEAARLIQALGDAPHGGRPTGGADLEGRWIRVLVTDRATGRERVNVRLPGRLLDLALGFGARFATDAGPDLEDIADALHAGARGKIVEVADDRGGQRLEVYID